MAVAFGALLSSSSRVRVYQCMDEGGLGSGIFPYLTLFLSSDSPSLALSI
jgi:hypothetical protein